MVYMIPETSMRRVTKNYVTRYLTLFETVITHHYSYL